MSLVNRIELANLNNMTGDLAQWDPMIRYIVIDTMGKSTMVNATNGGGKSTICVGVIGLLARNQKLMSDFHLRMSPPSTAEQPSVFSHLRVEFLVPDHNYAVGSGNLLSSVEDRVPGHKYVFGVYGHIGDQSRMVCYSYPGELEDAPILESVNCLHSNKAFVEGLRRAKAKVDPSREDWIADVSEHIERSSIMDMARIQCLPNEDKLIEYFLVRKKREFGSYDAAFFYEILAPILLSGLMDSEVDAAEEHSFQDTVLTSLKHVFKARSQVARKASELIKLRDTIGHLHGATESGQRALSIEQRLQIDLAAAKDRMATIQCLAVTRPLPGIPKPIAGDDVRDKLAGHICMSDSDATWRIRDQGVAWLIDQPVKVVNQLAGRNQFEGRQLSQVLEYTCDLYPRQPGHKPRYYLESEAIELVQAAQSARQGLAKSAAIDAINDAFWLIANKQDANPFRAARIAAEDTVEQDKHEIKEVDDQLAEASRRVEYLDNERKTVTADQNLFDEVAAAGLFTALELEQPAQTLATVEKDLRAKEISHNRLASDSARAEILLPAWKEVAAEFGTSEHPADILTRLREQKEAFRLAKQAKKAERDGLAAQAKREADVAVKENRLADTASIRLEGFAPLLEAMTQFELRHPGQTASTFESEVRKGIALEEQADRKATTLISDLVQAQADIDAYAALGTGLAPDLRLELARTEQLRVSGELHSLAGQERELTRQIEALNKEIIAPAEDYHRAIVHLGMASDYQFVHVHDILAKLPLDRKASAYQQFSALLFAPCFTDRESAALAAQSLADAKLRIPVVDAAGLTAYLDAPQDALTVFVGSLTREAACLLDPSLIPTERARLQEERASIQGQITHLTEELAEWALDAPIQIAATKCSAAEKKAPAANLPTARNAQTRARDAVERLSAVVNGESLQMIRRAADGFNQKARSLAEKAQTELERARGAATKAEGEAARLVKAYQAIDTEIVAIDGDYDAVLPATREGNLKAATELLKLALPTDRQAIDSLVAESGSVLAALRQRSQYTLALRAAQRHVERMLRGGASVDAELSGARAKKSELVARKTELDKSMATAAEHARTLKHPERLLDGVAIKIQRQHQACLAALSTLVAKSDAQSGPVIPEAASDLQQLLSGQITREVALQSEKLIDQLLVDLEDFDAEDVGRAIADLQRDRDRELKEFGRAAGDASKSSALRDVERGVLLEAVGLEGVAAVLNLHGTLSAKLAEEQEDHDKIARWEGEQFKAAADRLKSFIASAASGLDLLKSACKSDNSSNLRFHIEASVCDEESVDKMLQKLFADFEDDWERREAAAQKRGEADETVKKQDELLKEMIRETCYTKIFANPRIRYESSLLRKEGKHLFDLNQFSGGQKTAITLAWMVRLNDFRVRREMQKKGSTSLRRQARRYHSNFMIVDGLFSNLSHMPLINESLRDITAGKNDGRFQLIGLMHSPAYVNNPLIFPTLVLGRQNVTDPTKPGWLMVEQSKSAGSLEMTHLYVAPKTPPAKSLNLTAARA